MNQSKLYLGCAVWSYKGWVGNFYPAKTTPKNFLNLYSQQFNAVEGNTTFYAIPQPQTVTKWLHETTKNFKFCPKFPKEITHQGLLQPKIAQGVNFLQIISGLQDKLGLVFVQLPLSYSPHYLDDLQKFLTVFKHYSLAVEVRHSDWFISPYREQLNQMLKKLNITRVLLDTRPIYNCHDDPQINSSRRKPNVPLEPIITSNAAFVRFISHPEKKYNQVYLQEWSQQVSDWLKAGITVYFFVHCPIEDYSPDTANYFKTLLKDRGIAVNNLTKKSSNTVTQLNLFEL